MVPILVIVGGVLFLLAVDYRDKRQQTRRDAQHDAGLYDGLRGKSPASTDPHYRDGYENGKLIVEHTETPQPEETATPKEVV